MFNVTGGEVVIILILALVVLGPDKLPEAIRKFGQFYGEFKKMSTGFQTEMRNALDEPLRELRGTADLAKGIFDQPAEELKKTTDALRGAINSTMNPQPVTPEPSPGVAAALAAQQAEAAAAEAAAAQAAAGDEAAATDGDSAPASTLPDHSLRSVDMSDLIPAEQADTTSPDDAPNLTFGHTLAAIMREHEAPALPETVTGVAASQEAVAESSPGESSSLAASNGTPSIDVAATNTGIDIADKNALDVTELPAEEPFDPGPGPNFLSAAPPKLAEQYIIANAGKAAADEMTDNGANSE